MSKTDKTRPYWVRVKDFPILYPRKDDNDRYRSYDLCEWWRGELKCGCPICSDKWHRKLKARQERYAGRREARESYRDDQ